jgi:hypothetical protein
MSQSSKTFPQKADGRPARFHQDVRQHAVQMYATTAAKRPVGSSFGGLWLGEFAISNKRHFLAGIKLTLSHSSGALTQLKVFIWWHVTTYMWRLTFATSVDFIAQN